MLSIKTFSNTESAAKYYSHGDYYGSEGEGIWFGEGAKELGLKGEFKAKNNKEFVDLLNGILPNGQILGKVTKDETKHRPGLDLTFSVPKSFSIEMLINSDSDKRKEMEQVVMNAVSKTLKYIEKEGYVFCRKGHGGKEIEELNKLTFANFMHTTNRNLEPQVHVHCFLANIAHCKDGKYRSITNDRLLENGKFLGQVFRNELALETKKLGFKIHTTILPDNSSSFELSNIHPKLIEAFSTRRKEIVELFKQYNVTSKEGRDRIVINSRKAKKLIAPEELSKVWKKLDTDIKKEIEKCDLEDLSDKTEPLSAKDLAKLAINDTSYNKSVFSKEELLKNSLKHAIGNFSVSDLQHEMKNLEKNGTLIKHKNQFTTKDLLDKENQILKFASDSLGKSKSIIKDNKFDQHLAKFENRQRAKISKFKMNHQQVKAVKHILTSNDKIITLEGLPGVGKSTVLNAVRDISCKKIISLIGFGSKFKGSAPTASAANTLQESANVESRTLHNFLGKYSGYIEGRGSKRSLNYIKQEYKNSVIFVDEASLISTNIMHKLLKLQSKLDFRLVLVGDTKQLSSVEAGKPFEQILSVIKPIKLKEVIRQKHSKHKEAVEQASEGKINRTFELHDKNINQTSSENLAKNAANLYLAKNKFQQNNTLLISPTRLLRDQINDEVRNGLQKQNIIIGKEVNFAALRSKDMRMLDHNFSYMYSPGDIIGFNTKYANGIDKNDYLKVKAINPTSNALILEKSGKEIIFNLRKNTDYSNKIQVFKEVNLKLQEGLKITFTKNNKEFGLINSEIATIQKLEHNFVKLAFENGSTKAIPCSKLKHIDYGYCITIHSAQGKTFENTIAAINDNKLLNNQKMWLVALSRHKSEFTALVEDKNKLQAYLLSNTGAVKSATELQSNIDCNNPKSSELQRMMKNDTIRLSSEIQVAGKI